MARANSAVKLLTEIRRNPIFDEALLPIDRAQAVVWLMEELSSGGIGVICHRAGKAGHERREWLMAVCRDDLERTLAEAKRLLTETVATHEARRKEGRNGHRQADS